MPTLPNGVDIHAEDHGPVRPAVNVKYYGRMPHDAVQAKFGCDLKTAERALEFAWQNAVEAFWSIAQQEAEDALGNGITVSQEGRSGGWLVVDGLPPLKEWKPKLVKKWLAFERTMQGDIAYRMSTKHLLDDIEANGWADPDAELYNHIETATGDKTMPQMKRVLNAARAAFLRKPLPANFDSLTDAELLVWLAALTEKAI